MDNVGQKSGSTRETTRAQIVSTFNRLLLKGESNRPRVAEAGVARSTFYDHFDGVEALFDESLSMLLGRIAKAIVGADDREDMVWLLEHIYENRERGHDLLAGPSANRTEKLLSRLLLQELEGQTDARLHAILIAGTAIAALSAWVAGQLSASPEELAIRLLKTGQAILQS